jgi:SAM-dependent methyltransferase
LYEKKNDWLFGGNVHRNASKTSNKMKKEESWYVGCEDLSGILEKYVRKDAKILHVGCGQSKLCAQLVCRGYSHVCGLDNIKNIAHQLEREELYQTLQEYLHFYAQENFDYLQPTWLFQKEYFDCIFATNHLDFLASKNTVSLNGVLGEVTRCLKPGGIFFFVTCRHHKETEKMNDTDEIGYVEDDLVQTAQEFDCWWTWESVSNLLKRQLQPITTYRVGVPTKLIDNLNGKVRHEKPFRVFIWRRKETIVQRKLRIIAENAWERDRQAELDLFEQNRRDKLSKQLEEQRVIHESAMMLQENLLSTLINQNDLYESEITHRQQIRKQILLQMLEEERNEMINEDESSACMRTFEKQMRLYCRDLVVSSINNAVVIVETKTEIAQRANQGVMACVAYCLEHIFAISEWQIEIANARKPSEKGLIQFLKNAIEATSTTVVAPTANTTSIEQHAEHLSNLSQSSPAIKDEASSGQQKKQATVSEQVNGIMEELIRKVEEREDTSRTTEVALNAPVKRLELVKPQKELPVMQVVKEPLASSTIAPVQKTSNSAPEEIVAPLSTTTRLVKESEEKIDITIAAQKQYLAQSISLENVTKSETVESDERRRSIDNESPQIPENCKKANSSDKVFEKSQQEGEIVQEILREIAERVVQLNL